MRKLIYSLFLCSFILLFTACGDDNKDESSPTQTTTIIINTYPKNFPQESVNWKYAIAEDYSSPLHARYSDITDMYVVESLGKALFTEIPNAYIKTFYSPGCYDRHYCGGIWDSFIEIEIYSETDDSDTFLYRIRAEFATPNNSTLDVLIHIIKTEPTKLYINHKVDVPVE